MLLVLALALLVAFAFWFNAHTPRYQQACQGQAHHVQAYTFHSTENDIHKYQKRLLANMDEFYRLYQGSFKYGACDAEYFGRMRRHAQRVSKNAYEIMQRLPNDHKKHEELQGAIKNIMHILKVHMEDTKLRCKLPNVHPDPIGDYYYVTMLKAFNDG